MQIFEEGRLTDSLGRKVDFRNTIIIMTSNLGADMLKKSSEVGFGAKENLDIKYIEEQIEKAAKKHFKPELLNRLDDKVIFHPLSKEALKKVIDLEFNKLKTRVADKNLFIDIDEKTVEFLVNKGYQPEMGARPIRKVIVQYLEDPISEKLLLSEGQGKHITITVEDDKIKLVEQEEKVPV